jgi:hypothetical protein
MGMFDYVICEHELPLPKDQKELADIKWNTYQFQSKNMNCLMDDYRINKKGKLLVRAGRTDFFDDPSQTLPEVESNYHGELEFYAYEQRNKYDYSVTFNAKFSNGNLDKIKLSEFEKHSNEKRKKYQAEFEEERNRFKKLTQSWWFPIYVTLYKTPVQRISKYTYKLLQKLISNWFRYEQKILPW